MNRSRLAPTFVTLLLAGCASLSLVHTWQDPDIPPKPYRSFLVVGVSDKLQVRQVFEEIMVTELRKHGATATPSYTIAAARDRLTRSAVEKAVQETGADAVITTRLVDLKEKSHTAAGYVMTDRGIGGYASMYGTGTISYATFDAKPVEITTSRTYALETNLFDTTTQHPVWRGMTNAVDPKGIITLSEKHAPVVTDALTRKGFIK